MAASVDPTASPISTYDLLGVGFGPANIAIAVAVADRWSPNEVCQQSSHISNDPSNLTCSSTDNVGPEKPTCYFRREECRIPMASGNAHSGR